MATYVQADRPLTVTTPLGEDVLLLVGFTGQEGLSQLFSFQLDLLAVNGTEVAFDKLLGRTVTITLALPNEQRRYFNGICNKVSQGERDDTFTHYQIDIVPQFWVLTRRAQSRIFQHSPVPDILKKVLEGLDVHYEIQGTFHPRDFCVQYRETDFNFASRIMEEEGIFYFFKHTADGHKMVVANTPQSHSDLAAGSKVIYEELEGGTRDEDRVYGWRKIQELRSGKYTLWDHCFELPGKNLEADSTIIDSVMAGKVSHMLKVGGNDKFEIYDYPGEYAQRFDGVDGMGGNQPGDLQKIFEDNKRTVKLRIEEETVPGLVIEASSNCRQFVSGHRFSLERHFDADGEYLLTSIQHSARLAGDYRSGGSSAFQYHNTFTCIPFAVPYRPLRRTPKPFIQGSQTASVVGPAGEEIFTDKYGRVKVQFHWDRESQANEKSSCWIRVAQTWAGKRWGTMFLPRIGQEVVVDFLEGDPDQPIIIGSVYNAEQMPPYPLPEHKTRSTIKSRSSKGEGVQGFNEIRFEDKKGQEQFFIHAERNQDIRIKKDRFETVGEEYHLIVGKDHFEQIKGDRHHHVQGDQNGKVDGTISLEAGMDMQEKVGMKYALDAGMEIHLKAGMNLVIEAGMSITLKAGAGFIVIGPAGVTVSGIPILLNSGGAAGAGSGSSPQSPQAPKEADKAEG